MRTCSILIPTYNGRDILAECLPSVTEAVAARGGADEIIILDNAGADDTAEFINSKFPACRVVTLPDNKAIFALNDGARAANHDFLFLLNNDMLLNPGCIDALLARFDDPAVFAATGRVYRRDGSVQAARRRPVFSNGRFWYVDAGDPPAPALSLHALGGQSIVHKQKFLEIGGLDDLFSPFYHEDLDISWRALRRGWKIIYEPRAEMIHFGAVTAGRMFSKKQINTMIQKNLFLFVWKNIHDPGMTASHLAWLAPHLARAAVTLDTSFISGLAAAIRQLPAALRARKSAAGSPLSDNDVFKLFDTEPTP